LSPERSLYAVSPTTARFVADLGGSPAVPWSVAAELVAMGAIVLEPDGPVRPVLQRPSQPPRLVQVCPIPVAPSPEAWVSSRIAAQWNAMTVWSLTDDLYGAVESGHRNRIMPILRKAELFLRMMAMAVTSVRSEVTRNAAMDLQGCALQDGFPELIDLVYTDRGEDVQQLPRAAVALFSSVMASCGMPARADMFERSRSFMKQLSDVRMWFRVSEGLGIPFRAPNTLLAKGAGSESSSSSVFVDLS
jgi:hypothetical protein